MDDYYSEYEEAASVEDEDPKDPCEWLFGNIDFLLDVYDELLYVYPYIFNYVRSEIFLNFLHVCYLDQIHLSKFGMSADNKGFINIEEFENIHRIINKTVYVKKEILYLFFKQWLIPSFVLC